MMVSWDDAVNNAVSPEAQEAYDRMIAQIRELNVLAKDFIKVIQQGGKWPMEAKSESDSTLVPRSLNTGLNSQRHVWFYTDGTWGAYDFLWREAPHPEQVFIYRDSGSIEVGFCCKTMLDTVSNRNFRELCDAVARAMDWIPRELIKYLRNNELPIPSH